MTSADARSGIEALLRQDLAEGDAMIASVSPIMRHLLVNENHSLFGDEVLARVRGMIHHLAVQLCGEAALVSDDEPAHPALEILASALVQQPKLLAHVHALAIEWQMAIRLQARLAIDPTLSPLLQSLIASRNDGLSGLAMSLLAAQTRFGQAMRRMHLPLGELPADLGAICMQMRATIVSDPDDAGPALRDQSRSRLGLISRLLDQLGASAADALSVSNAGVALFFSALALAAGQDRDLAVLGATDGQFARLTLMLRAAGMKPEGVAEQMAAFYPDITMPEDFDQIRSDSAAALLAQSSLRWGG